MMQRTALIAGDEKEYRYTLGRQWRGGDTPRLMAWIMLNPSKADTNIDDTTIKRCMSTAGRMGYDGIVVANLFALRATNPKRLSLSSDPVGPDNDDAILEVAKNADMLVVAWGAPKNRLIASRAEAVEGLLSDWPLFAVALSKQGHPRHPLYLPLPLVPKTWKSLRSIQSGDRTE